MITGLIQLEKFSASIGHLLTHFTITKKKVFLNLLKTGFLFVYWKYGIGFPIIYNGTCGNWWDHWKPFKQRRKEIDKLRYLECRELKKISQDDKMIKEMIPYSVYCINFIRIKHKKYIQYKNWIFF